MHPFRGLFHDGDHSLSEPLHLFPQGPQALSAIEEIKHCHHSPGVCLWKRGNEATKLDFGGQMYSLCLQELPPPALPLLVAVP